MELYYVLSVLDRDKRARQEKIYKSLGLRLSLVMMGRGTATRAHLSMHGLTLSEKVAVATIADRETAALLFRRTKEKLFIDIPGNGIMVSVPVKSVGGAGTLEQLTNQAAGTPGKPDMNFEYELIYVILNEGHSDEVMDAARPAGATGGTVLTAKGTGIRQAEKFKGLSLADRKEVILIVARSEDKAGIMQAILEKAGPRTPAGAICFSLPVSQAAGLRRIEVEE
jgi:hypothetical protein